MDSTAGAFIYDTQPMSDEDLLCRDEEIRYLMAHENKRWGLINGRIKASGEPTAYGTYMGLAAVPVAGTLANVASVNGENALWATSLYSPWVAQSLVGPSGWELYVSWQTITSTSPGNVTINPRIGSFASGASTTGGVALGADAAITLTASITTNWRCRGEITVDSIGIPGANSKADSTFSVIGKPASAGNGAATINDIFGCTTASFDASITSGVVLGMANTVTTINYSVLQVHWVSMF